MKTIACLLAATLISHAAPEAIFDGKSLDGWKIKGSEVWAAKDGILTGTSNEKKQGSILWTEKEYGDFVFQCEFKFEGRIDSGVFLRHETDQIQIGISGSLKRDMTASPYISKIGKYPVEAKGVAELLKEGEWNTMEITVKGNAYGVVLNGKHVMDYTSDTAKDKGPIGLQVHAGVKMAIDFRNITVAPR
ncbi:DUF1080 domain-containing protein [Akkermansiaceae bacterium]|nr:DUF1080 domain-containing protein [Akkermansiaceae bacterium]